MMQFKLEESGSAYLWWYSCDSGRQETVSISGRILGQTDCENQLFHFEHLENLLQGQLQEARVSYQVKAAIVFQAGILYRWNGCGTADVEEGEKCMSFDVDVLFQNCRDWDCHCITEPYFKQGRKGKKRQ